jgi:hypothetical protein
VAGANQVQNSRAKFAAETPSSTTGPLNEANIRNDTATDSADSFVPAVCVWAISTAAATAEYTSTTPISRRSTVRRWRSIPASSASAVHAGRSIVPPGPGACGDDARISASMRPA